MTSTKTKTNIKLLIATAALAAAGGLAFILFPKINNTYTRVPVSNYYICADSDGGVNPAQAGTATLRNPSTGATIQTSADFCGTPTSTPQYVNELSCVVPTNANAYITSQKISCTKGCSAGACLP